MHSSSDITRLVAIMTALRDPKTGCPWDVQQTFASIAPYTIEEAFEVADAIEREDWLDLRDELGDLLLQVVFHSQLAAERGDFTFEDVVLSITRKMIRRHPHVFGDTAAAGPEAAKKSWNEIKAKEKAERPSGTGSSSPHAGVLASVPPKMPALMLAQKLQARAAEVGFDWSKAEPILDKLEEEIGELRSALAGPSEQAIGAEMGDVLFSIVNLCRHLTIDAESALRGTNEKFRRRFGFVEEQLRQKGMAPEDATLSEMEALWQQAKRFDR